MQRIVFLLFFLSVILSCKKDDPCKGINCQNGGVCINGDCDCPDGWTGPDCTDQETPLNIRITDVTLTRYPIYDNAGSPWDIGNAPDLYITITVNGSKVYDGTTSRYQNTTSANLLFIPNIIVQPNDLIVMQVYDYDDFDADDFMGGVQGFLYSSTGGFPDNSTLDCSGCKVAFDVGLEYRF